MFINRNHDAFCQINVVHATNLASGAESAILIDANSQQVLYHKNETKRLYPASTTKIMTMILLFEAIKEKGLIGMIHLVVQPMLQVWEEVKFI